MISNTGNLTPEMRQLHKFGGSSLADAQCFLRVVEIMDQYSNPCDLMVVSAAGNTTNQLINWYHLSQKNRLSAFQVQLQLRHYQIELIETLLPELKANQVKSQLIQDLETLSALLDSEEQQGSAATYAEVVGQGEIWSARLMSEVLQSKGIKAEFVDARNFLRTERAAQPQVNEAESRPLLQQILVEKADCLSVITGFIASNTEGETVLLGRNGSDYSATQIGALAGVKQVTIWSDVAGVFSADPRKVPDACLLPLLRLDEANELARLAAPVLHTRTLQPVASSEVDLQLRSSYQPELGSTRIERVLASGTGARIVTSHDAVCLIDIVISQGQDFTRVKREIEQSLQRVQLRPLAMGSHIDTGLLQFCYTDEIVDSAYRMLQGLHLPVTLAIRHGYVLVAMVGAGVTRNPLHCHRFWQKINDMPLEFVWQSDEDISLVAVLRKTPTTHVITGLHQSLFRAEKRIGLVLLGKGNIGSRWLELFTIEQDKLTGRSDFEFVLAAVADKNRSMFDYAGLDPSRALAFFNEEAKPHDPPTFLAWMQAHPFDDLVILDVTASSQVAQEYQNFASNGFHVISANKIAGSSKSQNWRQIRDAFLRTGRHWLYNATVGAGLPINHTVRDLRQSGDSILAISGIFSGTLSWIFLQYDGKTPFTQLVEQAWQQGLTEPDPRDDLSGQDVMRKLVILARESGVDIEPEDVRVESLVPDKCLDTSIDFFFENSQELDQRMLERFKAAQELGLILRYVARFDASGRARVGIEAIHSEHPLASLLPCDNVFAIESRWYRDNPLVIRGPGAGRDVTAGAIQSDLNHLSQLL